MSITVLSDATYNNSTDTVSQEWTTPNHKFNLQQFCITYSTKTGSESARGFITWPRYVMSTQPSCYTTLYWLILLPLQPQYLFFHQRGKLWSFCVSISTSLWVKVKVCPLQRSRLKCLLCTLRLVKEWYKLACNRIEMCINALSVVCCSRTSWLGK